jgi:phospholipid/cholesterol/gamma-HCH transport system substrate-binding protein
MRRIAAILLTLIATGAVAVLVFGSSAQGSSTASFDVIFDDARGLIGGQLVKIAGANAGTIENVVVTPDFKARIEANVESRFMPFHQDATCTIRPEGLIAENYVDCDPGSADSPPLRASGGYPPTVPVTNTSEPVSLLDLFNIFNVPTRERFSMIIDELGVGTAGEGGNFNDILRRANPALQLARQAISILARQRSQLATIVSATNTIASQAATHTTDLQNFLDRASSLTTLTASHSSALSQAINRLPGLLAAAQPALQQLDTVAVQGTPLVQQIHAAVPALNRVSADLGPFVKIAKPALLKLGSALKKAIPAIRDTTPLVSTLRSYADRSLSGTALVAKLFENLQQHGFVENFLSLPYYISASLARFDSTSHLLALLLVGADNGLCGMYATTPIPACSAHYGSQPTYKSSPQLDRASTGSQFGASASRTAKKKPASTSTTVSSPSAAGSTASSTSTSSASSAPAAAPAAPPSAGSGSTQQSLQTLQNLVNFLLK